jgi:hypothetical protein
VELSNPAREEDPKEPDAPWAPGRIQLSEAGEAGLAQPCLRKSSGTWYQWSLIQCDDK